MAEQKVNIGGAQTQEQPKVEQPKVEVAPKVEQVSMYQQAIALVDQMVPKDKFRFNQATSGLSIFDNGGGRGTRLLKVVESKKGLRVEFNVDVEKVLKEKAPNDNITFTEKQAKEKHMGTCRWIYTGNDINVLKQLITLALSGFAPKVKEEKKKEEVPAATAAPVAPTATEAPKKEEAKPAEPVKGTRKLTEAEMKQMGATATKPAVKQEQQKKAQ